MGRASRLVPAGGIALVAVLLGVAAAGAATATVDFESGPPIGQPVENQYAESGYIYWQRPDPGFRPYRRTAGVATSSGTVAADISPAHCYPEEEDNPANCELVGGGTQGRLTRVAHGISLYTGLFEAASGSVSATLTAYNLAGTPLASSSAPIGVGITTPLSVSSGSAEITHFQLVASGPGAPGAALGFDDLSVHVPDAPCPDPTIDSPTQDRVTSPHELAARLQSGAPMRLIVPADVRWEMKDCAGNLLRNLPVGSGVQIVGERGDLGSRPLLYTNDKPKVNNESIFRITGNDVRIEGIHLRGFKLVKDHATRQDPFYQHGITVVEDFDEMLGRRIVIADNEFDRWTGGGVNVVGSHDVVNPSKWQSGWARPDRSDARLVRVVANYMHNNAQDGGGYGVVLGCCAYVSVTGNVFDVNRHAVAASGKAYSGYIARYNYVLQGGVKQDSYWNQHFDVHGTADDGYGGYAGEYFLIADNTIRGEQSYYVVKTRPAFMLRGRTGDPRDHRTPPNGSYFNGNYAVHDDLDAAVSLKNRGDSGIGESHEAFNFHARGNRFDVDYTAEIASGDFDGDGRTDVFLANGTGWFFSRAGERPWEFIDGSNRRIRDLAFADVDNDGITDVIFQKPGGKLIYLKRGSSPSVPLPSAPVDVKALRFGDFDGDGRTDIFYTRARKWRVWYGATRAWRQTQSSVTPVGEMLFGEFDETTGTDIAAVRNGQWSYSSGATDGWARLNSKRRDSFRSAVAADFDGNGKPDIAFGNGRKWVYSRDGRGPLVPLRTGRVLPVYPDLNQLLIGHFDGGTRATVVGWNRVPHPTVPAVFRPGLRLVEWRGLGSSQAFAGLSRQNMR